MTGGSGAIGAACEVLETATNNNPAAAIANTIRVIVFSLIYSPRFVARQKNAITDPGQIQRAVDRTAHAISLRCCGYASEYAHRDEQA